MSDNNNDILHVEGGKPLNGTIKVRGAKNFVSKAMVAALLAPGTSVLKNVPEIRDVHVVSDLLRLHGVDVTVDGDHGVVTIDATNVQLADVADVDTLSGSSRIPILFSGPLLHRLGEAFIPALGGCNIGGRPIDFHLETLRKLGANVDKEHKDGIHITAPNGLHGAKIHLPYPSVGATEQTLLAAVLAAFCAFVAAVSAPVFAACALATAASAAVLFPATEFRCCSARPLTLQGLAAPL